MEVYMYRATTVPHFKVFIFTNGYRNTQNDQKTSGQYSQSKMLFNQNMRYNCCLTVVFLLWLIAPLITCNELIALGDFNLILDKQI